MPRLVAVDADLGPSFVTTLLHVWEFCNAVLPVDPRLPAPARQALLDAMRVGDEVDDGDALVVPTSGSTGEPKGVVLTHDAIAASAAASSARLGVEAGDRWLACLPLAHIGGLSVVTRALATSTPLTFDLDDPTATLVSLVPTQLDRMDASRFRVVLLGASADWRAERPANVVRTYGMTETGSGIAYDGVPLDGVDLRIDDEGQVWVRGAMLLRCYRDGTDPKDASGWFATGDAGAWRDGRLHIDGRMGDVIVTGGEKVWPAAVEAVLQEHPAVREVAVVGRPDDEWGRRVVAVVVPADEREPPTLDSLRGWVKERLPAYAAPREVELVDALPRTAIGKVRRAGL